MCGSGKGSPTNRIKQPGKQPGLKLILIDQLTVGARPASTRELTWRHWAAYLVYWNIALFVFEAGFIWHVAALATQWNLSKDNLKCEDNNKVHWPPLDSLPWCSSLFSHFCRTSSMPSLRDDVWTADTVVKVEAMKLASRGHTLRV